MLEGREWRGAVRGPRFCVGGGLRVGRRRESREDGGCRGAEGVGGA